MLAIPRLSNDVLHIISEKLLFKKPPNDKMFNQMDLRKPNAYTRFMYHSADKMRAFFLIFSRMKRLELLGTRGDCMISFYKDEMMLNKMSSCDFAGPYIVNKKIISNLFDAGLFRVLFIRICNFLEDLPVLDNFSTPGNEGALRHLLKVEAPSTSESYLFSSNSNLRISKLEVDEPAEILQKHLMTLLSINAENVEFSSFWENLIFECASTERQMIIYERTKKIQTKCILDMESKNNFFDRLKSNVHFLLSCCSNIEYMEFKFSCNSTSPSEHIKALEILIVSIVEHLKLSDIGSKRLKIRMEFTANFEETLFESIPNDHKLFSLGKSFLIDELADDSPYIAHIIEFNDSIGRNHECLFQIFSEKPDLSDYYATGSIYSYDGYDNYPSDYEYGSDFDEY